AYAYLGRLLSAPLDDQGQTWLAQLDAQSLQNATFYAVERLFERTAAQQPLVIVCEDLHWVDPTSLRLLERLLSLTDRASLLLICVFRPEREHGCWRIRETALRDYPHRHIDLELQPLSATDGEALIRNLLVSLPGPGGRRTVEGLPGELKTEILERGEGNPFYVEEVLRSLIRSGAVLCHADTCEWQAGEDIAKHGPEVGLGIPDTLYGVLRGRIDRLPVGARHVLELASVIGRIFSRRLLAEIAEGGTLDQRLVTLQRAQLIRPRMRRSPPKSLGPTEPEYLFEHQLTLEAAYGGLLHRRRRALHRRVAEALERLYPDRITAQLGLLAHHWE
ncbi:MAG: ATP-binding protein, partial [Anaerolineae bacterium]